MMAKRGPYKRYPLDTTAPIPKTTLWRMKKKARSLDLDLPNRGESNLASGRPIIIV